VGCQNPLASLPIHLHHTHTHTHRERERHTHINRTRVLTHTHTHTHTHIIDPSVERSTLSLYTDCLHVANAHVHIKAQMHIVASQPLHLHSSDTQVQPLMLLLLSHMSTVH